MRCITIRDLRQRWPEAEAALQVEDEILVTRDAQPVAKLVRVAERLPRRKQWDSQKHQRWLLRTWGNKSIRLVEKYLTVEREGLER